VEDLIVRAAERDTSLVKKLRALYWDTTDPPTIKPRVYKQSVEGRTSHANGNLQEDSRITAARPPLPEVNSNGSSVASSSSKYQDLTNVTNASKTSVTGSLPRTLSTLFNAREKEAPTRNEFEHCCDAVWRFVNELPIDAKYSRSYHGLQHRRFDALGTIIYTKIQRKAVRSSSFQTRFNAIYALLEIGMGILWPTSSDFAEDIRNGPVPQGSGM